MTFVSGHLICLYGLTAIAGVLGLCLFTGPVPGRWSRIALTSRCKCTVTMSNYETNVHKKQHLGGC